MEHLVAHDHQRRGRGEHLDQERGQACGEGPGSGPRHAALAPPGEEQPAERSRSEQGRQDGPVGRVEEALGPEEERLGNGRFDGDGERAGRRQAGEERGYRDEHGRNCEQQDETDRRTRVWARPHRDRVEQGSEPPAICRVEAFRAQLQRVVPAARQGQRPHEGRAAGIDRSDDDAVDGDHDGRALAVKANVDLGRPSRQIAQEETGLRHRPALRAAPGNHLAGLKAVGERGLAAAGDVRARGGPKTVQGRGQGDRNQRRHRDAGGTAA